jgi:CheY-like chemotaxis protein
MVTDDGFRKALMFNRGVGTVNRISIPGNSENGQVSLANKMTTPWVRVDPDQWHGTPLGVVPNNEVPNARSLPDASGFGGVARSEQSSVPMENVHNGRAEHSSTPRFRAKLSPARVLFVTDAPVHCPDLTQTLSHAHGFSICAEAIPWGQALKTIGRLRPHLVLLETARLGRNQLRLIRALRSNQPGMKLLYLGGDTASQAASALRAGADGCVSKGEDPEEVAQAIRDVLDGLIYVSEEMVCAGSRR